MAIYKNKKMFIVANLYVPIYNCSLNDLVVYESSKTIQHKHAW